MIFSYSIPPTVAMIAMNYLSVRLCHKHWKRNLVHTYTLYILGIEIPMLAIEGRTLLPAIRILENNIYRVQNASKSDRKQTSPNSIAW